MELRDDNSEVYHFIGIFPEKFLIVGLLVCHFDSKGIFLVGNKPANVERILTIVASVLVVVVAVGVVVLWLGLGKTPSATQSKQTVNTGQISEQTGSATVGTEDNAGASAGTQDMDNSGSDAQAEGTDSVDEGDSNSSGSQAIADDEVKKILLQQIKRDPADPFARGSVDAPVVVVEYSDYLCQYCHKWHQEVSPALAKYIEEGKVRLEVRNLTVIGALQSIPLVMASQAAANQGVFWEMHNVLFSHFRDGKIHNADVDYLTGIAKEAGVPDLNKFAQDATSEETKKQVRDSEAEALSVLGYVGTPFFIVNDQALSGYAPADQFTKLIDKEIAK